MARVQAGRCCQAQRPACGGASDIVANEPAGSVPVIGGRWCMLAAKGLLQLTGVTAKEAVALLNSKQH